MRKCSVFVIGLYGDGATMVHSKRTFAMRLREEKCARLREPALGVKRSTRVDSALSAWRTFTWGGTLSCFLLLSGVPCVAGNALDSEGGVASRSTLALPPSSLLTEDVRQVAKSVDLDNDLDAALQACPSMEKAGPPEMRSIRTCVAEAYYKTPSYQRMLGRYSAVMTTKEIGGVHVEVFSPQHGVSSRNQKRVLINLHGGAFQGGARFMSRMESLPIAALGRITVISIDYRQAPEHTFPAASEDVAAVYRELLKTHKAQNIGIYGCSAGGLLTAESIAWFQKEKLPMPGAAAMLCEGAAYWSGGDSGAIASAFGLWDSGDTLEVNPYFRGTKSSDALAFPAGSAQVMSRFPPTLLISSTRDVALSSVSFTHSILISQGVQAELHIWEGLGHGFLLDPDLPQARQAYALIVKFFDRHLGR
jgi:monoterpene epsilon-lactone hydrolase